MHGATYRPEDGLVDLYGRLETETSMQQLRFCFKNSIVTTNWFDAND